MDKMMIAACLSVFCGVSLWAATEAVDDTDVVEGPEAKAFAVEESAPLKEVADIEGPGVEAFAVEKPAPLKEVADIDRMSVVKVPVSSKGQKPKLSPSESQRRLRRLPT